MQPTIKEKANLAQRVAATHSERKADSSTVSIWKIPENYPLKMHCKVHMQIVRYAGAGDQIRA